MPNLSGLRRLPLRVRLTIWYILLLGLTLGLFSSYLYFQLKYSLLAQVDAALHVAASQALANLDYEDERLTFQNMELTQIARSNLSQPGFAVRLIGADGTGWDVLGNYPAIPSSPPPGPGYTTLTESKTTWRLYSQPIQPSGGHVVGWLQVAQSLQPIQETLAKMRLYLLLGLALVLFLAGAGGLFLADRALRPIDRMTHTAQSIGAGDLAQRIAYQGPPDEVGRLATTFDRMLDRLQAAFIRERRFTADASHELRTPLTALKGRIEVTRSRPRSKAEYDNALQDMGKEVDRFIRLTTDLLFLARLGQSHLRQQPETLDLSSLLEAVIDQIQPLAETKNLSLVKQLPPTLSIQSDPDHLIRLFLNLLDNAIKHTPPGGRVTVQAENKETTVSVTVNDTGPGIPPEHLPHLFEPFYRVEAARSRSQGGAGLGLAIAYEIAHAHGGDLCVQSEPGRGTTFTVQLPS